MNKNNLKNIIFALFIFIIEPTFTLFFKYIFSVIFGISHPEIVGIEITSLYLCLYAIPLFIFFQLPSSFFFYVLTIFVLFISNKIKVLSIRKVFYSFLLILLVIFILSSDSVSISQLVRIFINFIFMVEVVNYIFRKQREQN